MTQAQSRAGSAGPALAKAPTGIQGLDEVTEGGLPRGRPTLVCGSAGCGKTLLAMEFLVRGATQFQEPGVFLAFEETAEELAQNVRSLGFDLQDLIARNQLAVDYVRLERSEIEETGEYDLEGLFVRLGYAIDSLGARRVVLDTLEALFSGLSNEAILRGEIGRLFRWLKGKGVTSIITAERGAGTLTRRGLEEYVSDCVILLDHRVNEQISTRRLRIVKYRGSSHGTNEFPFLIDQSGISVVPITSAGMEYAASSERISTGVAGLDDMLGGKGFFQGSSILVSGTAGTGKTSLAAQFVAAACKRGQRCLYFSFEESPGQLVRNMRSIGMDLECWTNRDLLRIQSARPTRYGLEMHLVQIHKVIDEFKPVVVVVDPISNFLAAGTLSDAGSMLVRLIDHLKYRGITSLFTNLSQADALPEVTEVGVSSIIDSLLLLRDTERHDERCGMICILKSRGMAHSRQARGFQLTDHGIELGPPPGESPGLRNSRRRAKGKDAVG